MLLLLSPAKSLDYESPLPDALTALTALTATLPAFPARTKTLIGLLREKSVADIAQLMELSDKLAELNVQRYKAWRPRYSETNARPAVLAFDGDVYDGLRARQLDADDLLWAQDHLAILSGLYGVLRPLDWMQPYRLEMGTALANEAGGNLYRFWGADIARHLNKQLARDPSPVVVNLASQEYFRSVDQRVLKAGVVECVFEEWHKGAWKVISFNAKRARGMLARHAVLGRMSRPEQLESFADDGYAFDASASTLARKVFRRRVG
jgi:hypothetical protein